MPQANKRSSATLYQRRCRAVSHDQCMCHVSRGRLTTTTTDSRATHSTGPPSAARPENLTITTHCIVPAHNPSTNSHFPKNFGAQKQMPHTLFSLCCIQGPVHESSLPRECCKTFSSLGFCVGDSAQQFLHQRSHKKTRTGFHRVLCVWFCSFGTR